MAKILVVEDDPMVSRTVQRWLEKKENHTVDVVADGADGLFYLMNYSYDLAILDWQLPGKLGSEICCALKQAGREIPILILTGRTSVSDRVTGLDSGAHDYMGKPVSLVELSARVRALLRRAHNTRKCLLYVGNLAISLDSHEARVDGAAVHLSPSEYMILVLLCQSHGVNFTSDSIIAKLWPDKTDVSKELVRTHIKHLRKKLEASGSQVRIVTGKGGGYAAVSEYADSLEEPES
jgi:two-component system, OmpR family, response regulator